MYTVGMIDIKDRECLQLSTMVIFFLKKHRDVIFDGFWVSNMWLIASGYASIWMSLLY